MKRSKWKRGLLFLVIICIVGFVVNKLVVYRMTSNKFLNQKELVELCTIYEKLYNSKAIEERKPYLTEEACKDEIVREKLVTDPNKNYNLSFQDLHFFSKINREKAYYDKEGEEIYFYPNPKFHRVLWILPQFPTENYLIFVVKEGKYYYTGRSGNMLPVL
ncbi:hypothetical protein KAU32_13180 [bacterium]|nr:hypothetical protein [bacterium]